MATVKARELAIASRPDKQTFVYPAEWIDVRDAPSGTIQLLVCDARLVRIYMICATTGGTGQYQVDWGDGTVTQYSSGATAYHNYTDGTGRACSYGYTIFKITVSGYSGTTLATFRLYHPPQLDESVSYPVLAIGVNCSTLTAFTRDLDTTAATLALSAVKMVVSASLTDLTRAFYFSSSLRSVKITGCSGVTSLEQAFHGCLNLNEFESDVFSAATDCSYAFFGCRSLGAMDLALFPSAQDCSSMFYECQALENVTNWSSLTDVTIAQNMFALCRGLLQADISAMSDLTTAEGMFADCVELISFTSGTHASLTTTAGMFNGCDSLVSANISGMTSVTDATSMFRDCQSLTSVTGTNFASASAGCVGTEMFYNVAALKTLSLANAAFSSFSIGQTASDQTCRLDSLTLDWAGAPWATGDYIRIRRTNLSVASFDAIFAALPAMSAITYLYLTNNTNAPTYGKSVTANTTKTVTCADTSSLANGMYMLDSSQSTARYATVSMTASTNVVNWTGHGLANGTIVYFSTIGTACNVSTWTPYYVVNTQTNTFQISLSEGGSAVDITADSASNTMRYTPKIVSFVANTSITFDCIIDYSGTFDAYFSILDVRLVRAKGWSTEV